MNNDFFDALEALEREKGIPKEFMLERVEAALLTGYKKENNNESNVRVAIDPVKRSIKMYRLMTVVEEVQDPNTELDLETARKKSKRAKIGDVQEYEFKPKNFGRIPAQNAKQVIVQGIREAERGRLIEEYEKKTEGIITGTVVIIERLTGNVILEFENTQATLLKAEQLPTDRFKVGDHVKVYVCEVKKETRSPIIVLSRTHPNFIKRLFETEVPEIQDGTVIIHAVAREAGSRTKVAVYSRDENVDPIGSCIGLKGMRKANILRQVPGEKIDLIKYSEDPAEFIAAALAPATVLSVDVNEDKTCQVAVAPDQLSLAIGKEGQNVRLAAKITGYKIDIKA
ncbi:MAG: transcription termination/antitermination protein NusA [Clostridia bacterium]|nr:transcription termination/antitermination protein NusA [Clostridia bacterium]